ncbi:MAG: CRISPR-associated protein Cas4 [Sulfolobales archaeon]
MSGELDLVLEIYKWRKSEREKHVREENTYYVTDLVRCPLKREYELIYPDLYAYEILSPPTIVGDMIHKGFQSLLRELYGSSVEIEVEGEKTVIVDNSVIKIKGRCDAIIKRDDSRIGVEIKSGRSDYNIPLEHHIDQARAYNWLFDLRETYLVYVTYERVTQYRVADKMSEEEIIARIRSTSYPRYSWECSYCPFSIMCPFKKIVK